MYFLLLNLTSLLRSRSVQEPPSRRSNLSDNPAIYTYGALRGRKGLLSRSSYFGSLSALTVRVLKLLILPATCLEGPVGSDPFWMLDSQQTPIH